MAWLIEKAAAVDGLRLLVFARCLSDVLGFFARAPAPSLEIVDRSSRLLPSVTAGKGVFARSFCRIHLLNWGIFFAIIRAERI